MRTWFQDDREARLKTFSRRKATLIRKVGNKEPIGTINT